MRRDKGDLPCDTMKSTTKDWATALKTDMAEIEHSLDDLAKW